jgi:hypothetical protein
MPDAQLDELERDAPARRRGLLGHVHHAATALTDGLEQLVTSDHAPGELVHRLDLDRAANVGGWGRRNRVVWLLRHRRQPRDVGFGFSRSVPIAAGILADALADVEY